MEAFMKLITHPLLRRDNSKNDIFDILRETKTGRVLLGNFACHLYDKVEFKAFPDEIRDKLRAVCTDGQPIGACFVNDGETGTVYFDPTLERGLLAIYFAHELTHALDERLWKSNAKEFILDSEARAYQTQNEFQKELDTAFKDFFKYLRDTYPNAKTIHEEMNRDQIEELYGFAKAA